MSSLQHHWELGRTDVSERQIWRRHVAAISLNERLSSCVIFAKGESYGWMIFRGLWVSRMPETAVHVTDNLI